MIRGKARPRSPRQTLGRVERREVRTSYTPSAMAVPGGEELPGRRRAAAWSLVVVTPLIAELSFGSTPIRMAWLVILWVPIYGAGVLFIRELVMRRGRGWPSILVMAVAYELLEDGVGLQALTSPHLYGAAQWGLRLFGFNVPYWEANVIYHAVFTVAVPIALMDLIFPRHVAKPYLGRTGTVVAGMVTLFGVLVLRVTVPVSQDPGYQAPWPFLAAVGMMVVALAVIALFAIPRPHRGRTARPAPRLLVLFVGSMIATLAFLALTFPVPGSRQPAFTHGLFVLVPMAVAAALAGAAFVAVRMLTDSTAWTTRHTLWLIGGALIGHSAGGVVAAQTQVDAIGLIAIIALTGLLLRLMDRRLRQREPQ